MGAQILEIAQRMQRSRPDQFYQALIYLGTSVVGVLENQPVSYLVNTYLATASPPRKLKDKVIRILVAAGISLVAQRYLPISLKGLAYQVTLELAVAYYTSETSPKLKTFEVTPPVELDWKKLRDENLQFDEAKGYQSIPLKSGEELHENTQAYLLEAIGSYQGNLETKITVQEIDCLAAAEQAAKRSKTAVLCFASTREPGGAFATGEQGTQEEALCYRSTLGGFMNHQQVLFDEGYYPLADHADDPNVSNHVPNKLLMTQSVQVFRDKNYELMNVPFEIGVMSGAAVVKPQQTEDGKYVLETQKDLMKRLILLQLTAAHNHGYERLILGAFGCGAFQNPPKEVASLYKECLENEFKGAFQEVVFAILGQENYQPFQETFKRS